MLDAFVRKNVRTILLTRTAERQNKQDEDAITSMVFTPVQFMPAEEAFACFAAVLPDLRTRVGQRRLASVHIEFWPSGGRAVSNNSDKMTRVEPDLKAQLSFEEGRSLVLVGEMKWESPILTAQIRRERESVKGEDAYVFAIVKNKGTLTKKTLECDVLYSWKDVHRNIERIRFKKGSPSRQWAMLVTDFLKLAEQLIFTGFNDVNFEGLSPPHGNAIFFFRQRPFRAFKFAFSGVPATDVAHVFYQRR
jgi:hypothetical protein